MTKTIAVCARCETPVTFDDVTEGYYAVCPRHDEDLFESEITLKSNDDISQRKFLAIFNDDNGFEGQVGCISSKQHLYNIVYDRVYLLDHLLADDGNMRSAEHISEEELLQIYRDVSHYQVHLVDSISDLYGLSDHPRYLSMVSNLNESYSSLVK